jgi:hypothetical protein
MVAATPALAEGVSVTADEIPLLAAELKQVITQLRELLAEPVADATKGSTQHHKVTGSPRAVASRGRPRGHDDPRGRPRPRGRPAFYQVVGRSRLRVQHQTLERRGGQLVRHTIAAEADRGGSDANTLAALNSIVKLVHGLPEDVARGARGQMEHWVEQARQIRDIGESEKWIPIHVPRGHLPPACPYCKTFSLRIAQESGRVACVNGKCEDSNGDRPRGRIEKNRVNGNVVLVWAAGRAIYYEGAA